MVLAAFGRRACLVVVLSLIPASVLAQGASTATIAGVVRDSSGAVLPGVTVEAASPALIEKVRSTVTDERGQYRLSELRPGTYTVTFSLAGFATLKREGLELRTNFTAQVDAELEVSQLRGDHHRHRRHAPGGRAERDAAAHGVARSARHGADGEERPRHRRADSRGRRAAERAGRRRQQGRALGPHHRARRQDVRLAPAAGRHALQRVDARHRQPRRHRPRLLRQSARRAGGRCRPRDDGLGRVLARRRAGEQHSQGRRQPVHGIVLRRRHRRRPPEQQPRRRPHRAGVDVGQQRQEGLRLQRRVRRTRAGRSPVVLCRGPPVGHDDGRRQPLCRHERDRLRLHAGQRAPDRARGVEQGHRRPPHLPGHLEGQAHLLVGQAAELPGSADRTARDRHHQERGQRGLLPATRGDPGGVEPAAVEQRSCSTPASR